MNFGLTKWRSIQPYRRPDKIISSDARFRNDMIGFVPPYEEDPRVNMYFLMSNEYYRMWFAERKKYEKIAYAQIESQKREKDITRPFVPRAIKKIVDEEEDSKLSIQQRLKSSIKTYPKRKRAKTAKTPRPKHH